MEEKLQARRMEIWNADPELRDLNQRLALAARKYNASASAQPDRQQNLDALTLHDILFQFAPAADTRDKFHKQFAARKDVPLIGWRGLLPGFYLGESPDLSPGTPLRKWLERTKTPFYIMTNYAAGNYTEKTGAATYQALVIHMGYSSGSRV